MAEMIGLDRLTGVIAFARAASLGSYAAAAKSLSISPSAVSKSINRLEERLGFKLFTRTTRSLVLTSEGTGLYEHALRLLEGAERVEQAALVARTEPSGLIRVSASAPVGIHLIAPHLPRFRQLHPRLSVDLRLDDRLTDLVQDSIDVAVRVGEPADSRLIARKLATNTLCAFASPGYLARAGTPMEPADLYRHDCVRVRFQNSGQLLRWCFLSGNEVVEVQPRAGIVVDNSDAVIAAVVNGGGIGVSPTYLAAPYVAKGALVPVLTDYCVDRGQITALWTESRRYNPNVKAFVTFFADVLAEPMPWNPLMADDNSQ